MKCEIHKDKFNKICVGPVSRKDLNKRRDIPECQNPKIHEHVKSHQVGLWIEYILIKSQ